MKYLCLVYAEEQRIAALSGGEWDALVAENLALCEELRRSGHYVGAAPLDSVKTAATVRVRHGRPATTDGPFAETKEQLGGYYLIEARDLDEAVQIAARTRARASEASRSGASRRTTRASPGLAGSSGPRPSRAPRRTRG